MISMRADLDVAARRVLEAFAARAWGRTHIRQPGDQARVVPRGWVPTGLADQNPGMVGHNYHFHIRLSCPYGQADAAVRPSAAWRRLTARSSLVVHPRTRRHPSGGRQTAVDDGLAGRLHQAAARRDKRFSSTGASEPEVRLARSFALLMQMPCCTAGCGWRAVVRLNPAHDSLRGWACAGLSRGDSPGKAKPGLVGAPLRRFAPSAGHLPPGGQPPSRGRPW